MQDKRKIIILGRSGRLLFGDHWKKQMALEVLGLKSPRFVQRVANGEFSIPANWWLKISAYIRARKKENDKELLREIDNIR